MGKYQIYGIGAALVDTEVIVSDAFLQNNGIHKCVMTLVDESRYSLVARLRLMMTVSTLLAVLKSPV